MNAPPSAADCGCNQKNAVAALGRVPYFANGSSRAARPQGRQSLDNHELPVRLTSQPFMKRTYSSEGLGTLRASRPVRNPIVKRSFRFNVCNPA